MGTSRLLRTQSGIIIAARVNMVTGLLRRAIGLLGRARLEADEGIWLVPCNGVHTFGMRFPIDVLILNRELHVVKISTRIKPWRAIIGCRGGYSTVELRAGTLENANVQVGDRIVMELNG